MARHATECTKCGGGTGQPYPCRCAAQLVALRELSLYHWRTALYYRAQDLNESANFHIGFVQLLNDFFPVGDTAEQDAEIRNRKANPMYRLDNED